MVQTESLPSTRHSREKVWEEETAGVWKSHYRFYTSGGKLPFRVVRVWHYTPRFNVWQMFNIAWYAVIPEWLCSMLCYEGPFPTMGGHKTSSNFFNHKLFIFFYVMQQVIFPQQMVWLHQECVFLSQSNSLHKHLKITMTN